MKYAALLLPLLFIALFVYALIRKVRLYDCFTEGVKGAVPLILSIFPYLVSVLILSELFERSGLSALLTQGLAPAFSFLGIPPEIGKLVLLKPFSGSGSTALLADLLASYGADSYIGRCACVAFGSSETVFFISAVYFAGSKKSLLKPVVIALFSNFLSLILGCLFCKIM